MAIISKPIRPHIETHDRHTIQRGFWCWVPMPKETADCLMAEADVVVNSYLREIEHVQVRYRLMAGGAEWDNRRRQVR